jgi:PST family polysaccharide transporter
VKTSLAEKEASAATSAGGLRGAAARGASFAAVTTIAVQILTLGTYVVLARLAPPSVFGEFAAGSILLGLGQMFTETGMPAALLQRRDNLDVAAVTALASTFIGGVLLALLALASSPIIGLYFRSHEVALVAAALSGQLIINGITGVPGTLLQRRLALRRWAVDPVAAVMFGVVSGVCLASGFGVWGLVIGWYASAATRTLWLWIGVGWLPDPRLISFNMWRQLARFGRHILASEILREVQNVATTAIMGRYLGTTDLGKFRFGWQLVSSATTPVLAANASTIQPVYVRISQDRAQIRRVVLASLRVVSFLAFPIGAVFIPLGAAFSVILFGEAWRGTGSIMMILSGMAIALPMASVSSEIFKVSGHPDILPRMHGLWTTLSIVLMLALVSTGANGVASAWSVSTISLALYALTRLPRVVPVGLREIARAISPPLLSATIVGFSLLVFNSYILHFHPADDLHTVAVTICEILGGLVTYFSGVALLARESLNEIRLTLRAMVRRRSTGDDAQAAQLLTPVSRN